MPSVVLPEPDSPTMPSVSPRLQLQVARRTASKRRLARTSRAGCVNVDADVARLHQQRRVGRASAATTRCGRLASSLRVYGVLRVREHVGGPAGLDQPAALHHADAVR